MSEQATDEDVARWKVVHVQVEAWPSGYVCDSCRKVWPCPTVKLLARLEAVERENDNINDYVCSLEEEIKNLKD